MTFEACWAILDTVAASPNHRSDHGNNRIQIRRLIANLMSASTPIEEKMKSTKRSKGTSKPKIRWELLGLSDPRIIESTTPIEMIRREVSLLASRGFGEETTVRSARDNKGRGRQPNRGGMKRRGATESEGMAWDA